MMRKQFTMLTTLFFLLIGVFVLKPTVSFAQQDGLNDAAGEEVTEETLDSLNPLKQDGVDQATADQLSTPGGIVSRFLGVFAFPLAGLILFVMIVWGGFEMLMGAADKKSIDAGKQRVTAALIGFLLLFASYWIARIIEMMFGIQIL
jgi:hypothetical protein